MTMNKFLWPGVKREPIKMHTSNQKKKYTDDEVKIILDSSHLTHAELASKLDRTVDAIKRKRRDLERRQGIGYHRREPNAAS